MDDETLFVAYAESLLGQMPCARMNNNTRRNQLFLDPSLKGIIYHTIKFCDYYGFEYASIKNNIKVPLLKLETDFTSQSAGQLLTRIQAFAETIEGSDDMDPTKGISEEARRRMESGVYYVAGIDSGSTSTDVVILDQDGKIKSTMIIPTGGGAMMSAEKSLEKAVEKAGISKDDIVRIVTTGYGRAYINSGDDSITEITCHAKGAHYLNPNVRTVIDIGGQDIKAISIDENGAVKNFLMNDKCAAGTGRFLEMMARTLGLSLEEMSTMGLEWKENIVISSMCTVFAESEVVSLVAQNKAVSDIIHGLNMSVASKVGALAARLGQDNPGEYMMTGGVAKNKGITNALEEKLGASCIFAMRHSFAERLVQHFLHMRSAGRLNRGAIANHQLNWWLLTLLHDFPINTYCYNLPWYEFSTSLKSFFGRNLQAATARNFHSDNSYTLNAVILNNSSQFFTIIHLI